MRRNKPRRWKKYWPKIAKYGHKYDKGYVAVIGGEQYVGACKLAALSALRMGAGLVTMVVPDSVWSVYASHVLSLMVQPVGTAKAFNEYIKSEKITTVVIGPGAGVSAETKKKVLKVLACEKSVVIDADAITVFEGKAKELATAIQSPVVLTPHEGEFFDLFPEFEGSRKARALEAAKQLGAVIVLKGHRTIIASPSGKVVENANAPAYLATAGSGDVLSGMIGGLLAQGMPAFEAACAAVWLHGRAASALGKGMISEDLPEAIPAVLQEEKL